MNYILYNYLNNFIIIYLNNILVYSNTFKEYLMYLKIVIKLKKCKFKRRKIKFLKHIIGKDELRINLKNIEKIINYLVSTDITKVRKFIRLYNYYRKFIKDSNIYYIILVLYNFLPSIPM